MDESEQSVDLPADGNQARGLAEYAIAFCGGQLGTPADTVIERVEIFHQDSVACALSAIAERTEAPTVLRAEAREYPCPEPWGVPLFLSQEMLQPEKAILANSAAAREWDANGTNFGYAPERQATKGEFGHNDFYPVCVAGCQVGGHDGRTLVRSMLCLDEIRGRLAEVFALKDYKIDHVVHGAIASAAVFGALVGASVDQIEWAIGLTVAHYIPFRAIRAGHQLSYSKGASAAISAEAAVLSVRRALRGFIGPADIFRNPQAIFRLFEPTPEGKSPFSLRLTHSGDDFAILGMHFKLGLYEHQSAGAIQGLIDLLERTPGLIESANRIARIRIRIYEPAFSIIGDPAKRDPQTRQSADHSMVYIIATLVRKAMESQRTQWGELMLMPTDYSADALQHPLTRQLMRRVEFVHGGAEFDAKYPDGIPTELEIETSDGRRHASGLVMYPTGHARSAHPFKPLLDIKFNKLLAPHFDDPQTLLAPLIHLSRLDAAGVRQIYAFSSSRS